MQKILSPFTYTQSLSFFPPLPLILNSDLSFSPTSSPWHKCMSTTYNHTQSHGHIKEVSYHTIQVFCYWTTSPLLNCPKMAEIRETRCTHWVAMEAIPWSEHEIWEQQANRYKGVNDWLAISRQHWHFSHWCQLTARHDGQFIFLLALTAEKRRDREMRGGGQKNGNYMVDKQDDTHKKRT